MTIDARILSAAERLFDRDGFNATGMGRVIEATGLSSRTVYKHVPGKNALMAIVLSERQRRFFEQTDFSCADTLFASLLAWIDKSGSRGCLFFRLQAETGGSAPEITAQVTAYQAQLQAHIADLVIREIGVVDVELTDQIVALFEGATTAATYRGRAVVEAARAAALSLIASRHAR